MKNIYKIILSLAICICLALPFAGCDTYQNSENCRGIVKGYKYIGDKGEYNVYSQIELQFKHNVNAYFPYLVVLESYYEYYNCSTVEELFRNEDFIKSYSNTLLLEVKNGKAIFSINKAIKSKLTVYFYESVYSNSDSTVMIDSLNDYIGQFTYIPSLQEELSPQDKGLIKIYGNKIITEELELKDYKTQNATINSILKVSSFDNNYIINVTGKDGYNNGSVTCLVAIIVSNGIISEIKGIAVIGWIDQLYINDITDKFLNSFANNFEQNIYYSIDTGYLVTGATKTSNAICNAVNGAIEYFNKNQI